MRIDKVVVYSVIVGIAAVGLIKWGINALPSGNIITDSVKKAKSIASTS